MLTTTFVANASNLHKSTLRYTGDTICTVAFTVTDGNWEEAAGIFPKFGDGNKVFWLASEDANAGYEPDPDTHFDTYMEEEIFLVEKRGNTLIKNGYVVITLQEGAVIGLAVRLGSTEPFTIPEEDWKKGYTSLFPEKGGVTSDDEIIGTNPKLGPEE